VRKQPPIREGSIFTLGRHRLMCGSALLSEHRLALLAAGQIDLVLTDPPYCSGSTIEAKKAGSSSIGTRPRVAAKEKPRIKGDNLSTPGVIHDSN
jgi:DNA modification methylase